MVLSIPLVISHAVMLVGFALMLLYHVYWLLTELVNVCALKKEKEEKA